MPDYDNSKLRRLDLTVLLMRTRKAADVAEEGSDEPEHRLPTLGCIYQLRCPRFILGTCDIQEPPWRQNEQSSQHQIRCHIPINELSIVER